MLMIPRHDVHEPVGFAFARYCTKRSTTSRNGPKSLTLMTVMTLTLMTLMTLMTLTWMTLINLMTLKTLMTLMTLMILVILITLMTLMTLMTLLTLSHWPQRPGYSSQLQLRSGLGMLVSPLVRPSGKVTENRAKDFLAFLHERSTL